MDDGELAAWVEFDVPTDEWELHESEIAALGAPGGFSYAASETFAMHGNDPYDFAVFADAGCFDQRLIMEAALASLHPRFSVKLAHLYQFSWAPEPKVVIEIAMAALMASPADLLSLMLTELCNRLLTGFQGRNAEEHLTFDMRVHRTPKTKTTEIKIRSKDLAELTQALQQVPDILRAEGETVFWKGPEERWVPVPRSGSVHREVTPSEDAPTN
jgi:hypothetical protein